MSEVTLPHGPGAVPVSSVGLPGLQPLRAGDSVPVHGAPGAVGSVHLENRRSLGPSMGLPAAPP